MQSIQPVFIQGVVSEKGDLPLVEMDAGWCGILEIFFTLDDLRLARVHERNCGIAGSQVNAVVHFYSGHW